MVVSKRILLVEDEKCVADPSSRIIKGIDPSLEVVIAEDSETAMELLNAGEIGLALIDGNLTDGRTGPLVARAARGLDVPFIVTSGNVETIALFDRYEPYAYLTKPYTSDALTKKIKKFYSL